MVDSFLVRAGRLAGVCKRRATIGSMGLRIGGNEVCNLLKHGNTKGAAVVGVVLKLAPVASKRVSMFKRGVGNGRGQVCPEVNTVVRAPKFCPGLAKARGLRVFTGLHNATTPGTMGATLRVINLPCGSGGLFDGCSLNVGRELNVTGTVLRSPRLLVLSRPAGKLSPVNVTRMEGFVGSLDGRHKGAVLVSDRVLSRVRLLTSSVNVVSRNILLRRDYVRRLRGGGDHCVLLRISSVPGTIVLLRQRFTMRSCSMRSSRALELCSASLSVTTIGGTLVLRSMSIVDSNLYGSALRSCFGGVAKKRNVTWARSSEVSWATPRRIYLTSIIHDSLCTFFHLILLSTRKEGER